MSGRASDRPDPLHEQATPRWLEATVPAVMLVVTVAYAIELKDIPQPERNLILLEPLFIVFWALLLLVAWSFLVPIFRGTGRSAVQATSEPRQDPPDRSWRRRLAEDKAWRPRLLVALLVVYAAAAFSTNYLASTFVFLALASLLLGRRSPISIAVLSISASALLYFAATIVLGVAI